MYIESCLKNLFVTKNFNRSYLEQSPASLFRFWNTAGNLFVAEVSESRLNALAVTQQSDFSAR